MTGDDLLRCTAGVHEFAIRASDVRHVARVEQLRPDDVPDGRRGALKVGGQHVPVFSLAGILGLDEGGDQALHPDQHIAVTGDHDSLVGWLIDRIAHDLVTGDGGIAPLPATVGGRAQHWFDGVLTLLDGRPLLLLRPERLNPLRPDRDDHSDRDQVFSVPTAAAMAPSEPVALVFSTAALPPCDATRFALSGRQVAAIIQPVESLPIPGSAPHVSGLTMWRNAAVPMLDFRTERASDRMPVRQLIARCVSAGRPSLVGLLIDAEVVMHRPSSSDQLLLDVPCPPFANGVFKVDGEAVALLDLDSLVTPA